MRSTVRNRAILLSIILVCGLIKASPVFAATAATITVQSISSVIQGNILSVTCTVQNTGTDTRSFGVGAEVLEGGSFKVDLGTRTTSTISPGGSSSVTFTYTIPTSWAAKSYTLHAVAWSGTPGSSTWLDDDSRTFSVVARSVAATITIRSISSVIQGEQLSVTCDVQNGGNVSWSFGVGAEILDGATNKADLGTRTTASISPGLSSSVSFTYTVPTNWTAKSYTLHAVVWSGTPGSSTWLDDATRSFSIVAQNISGTITLRSISSVIQGEELSITYDIQNNGNVSWSYGVGAEILDGSTIKSDLGARTTPSIGPGSAVAITVFYTIPSNWPAKSYSMHVVLWSGTPGSSTWIDDDSRSFTVVTRTVSATIVVGPVGNANAGQNISIPYTIQNTGNVSNDFGLGCEVWKGTTKQSDVGSQRTGLVANGSSYSGSFTYAVPTNWGGTYFARIAIWSGVPGSSTWLNSGDSSFAITPIQLNLHGRIAYHSYYDYMVNSQNDSIDGNIFIYKTDNNSLVNLTGSLNIDHAMNPHFSPDGSMLVFMARPKSLLVPNRNQLEIYIYDIAEGILLPSLTSNSIPDEDPKFSPNGNQILFKRSGQIYRMNIDKTELTQLTSSAREKSGPNYSPDGSNITFWYDAKSTGDIGLMESGRANSDAILFGNNNNFQEMYPIFIDNNNILYSKWESADSDPAWPNPSDDVFKYTISTNTETKLPFNTTGIEDADAYPIDSQYCVFSSTRPGGKGVNSYDIYVARYDADIVYNLPAANSIHQDLGPCYSPYLYARKLKMINPANGNTFTQGAPCVLQVHAYSDGNSWTGINPTIIFSGPSNQSYSDLRDDGTMGDSTAGDGIYSLSVNLPNNIGAYSVYASAQSSDPGKSQTINSNPISITINNPSLPTITVTAPDSVASEAGDTGYFRISRTGSTASALTIICMMGGNAVYNTDYSLNRTSPVTISAGSSYVDVTLTPTNDSAVEGNETATLTISSSSSYNVGNPSSANIDIVDDDSPSLPTISVDAPDASAAENGDTGYFRISRTGSTASALNVYYSLSGTANNGTDYSLNDPSPATISAGATYVDIVLNPIDDIADEGTENATMTISVNSAYNVGTPSSASITITDNDNSTGWIFNPANGHYYKLSAPGTWQAAKAEAESVGGYLVTINNQAESDFLVTNFAGMNVNSAPAFWIGYTDEAVEGTWRWVNGETSSYTNWYSGEPNGSATSNEDYAAWYNNLAYSGQQKGKWVDYPPGPDPQPGIMEREELAYISVAALDSSASESGDTGYFRISRTGSTASAINVYFAMSGSTNNGSDYLLNKTSPVTISAGASYVDIIVTPINDTVTENTETVIMTIADSMAYNISASNRAILSIIDNDGGWIFNPANGHYYKLSASGTWQAAKAEAESVGGYLVTINNQAESDFLVTNFAGMNVNGAPAFWIGYTDEAVEGTWRWVNGETSSYTNWYSGEPNGSATSNEDYAAWYNNLAYSGQQNGKWVDYPPGPDPQPGIIERSGDSNVKQWVLYN